MAGEVHTYILIVYEIESASNSSFLHVGPLCQLFMSEEPTSLWAVCVQSPVGRQQEDVEVMRLGKRVSWR